MKTIWEPLSAQSSVTHLRFRVVRARHNLPDSPARLKGAPVTTLLAALFLAAVLCSTPFIDGLSWAWMAGAPFFAVLLVAYFIVERRGKTLERYDPLQEEIRANLLAQTPLLASARDESK